LGCVKVITLGIEDAAADVLFFFGTTATACKDMACAMAHARWCNSRTYVMGADLAARCGARFALA
jgi:hypothetical protein